MISFTAMKPKNRIRIILAEQNLKGKELAEKIGLSKTSVYSWINNKSQPSIKNLYRIAVVLDVSVCSILVDANKKPSELEAVSD